VDETTCFGSELSLSANSPSRDGQVSANCSYVTRPSSTASVAIVCSSLKAFPSPRSMSNVQPPCLKLSPPPGASMTPSSETNSVTTIFPMMFYFFDSYNAFHYLFISFSFYRQTTCLLRRVPELDAA